MGEKSVLLVNKRESYCLRTAHFPSCVALARLTARHRSGTTASPPDPKETETWPFFTTPNLRKLTAPRSSGQPPRGYQRAVSAFVSVVCVSGLFATFEHCPHCPLQLLQDLRSQLKGKSGAQAPDLRMAPPCASCVDSIYISTGQFGSGRCGRGATRGAERQRLR